MTPPGFEAFVDLWLHSAVPSLTRGVGEEAMREWFKTYRVPLSLGSFTTGLLLIYGHFVGARDWRVLWIVALSGLIGTLAVTLQIWLIVILTHKDRRERFNNALQWKPKRFSRLCIITTSTLVYIGIAGNVWALLWMLRLV
jgi:hypothetical protein